MSYVGKPPIDRTLGLSQKNTGVGDGSTTNFDILTTAAPEGGDTAVDVFVDNVRQEPGTGKAYVLAQDGSSEWKRITFSTAPASGAVIWTNNRLRTQVTNTLPGSGTITTALLGANSVTNAKMADDAVGVAELSATGTASTLTFLRGDNSWDSPLSGAVSLTTGNLYNNWTEITIDTTTTADPATVNAAVIGPVTINSSGTTGWTIDGQVTIF